MRFDMFDEEPETSSVIPDGTHECEIAAVKTVTVKTSGRELLVLTLRDAEQRWNPVQRFLDPSEPRDHKLAMQLIAALGLDRPEINDSVVGRMVKVTTKRAVKDGVQVLDAAGTPRVWVNAFEPSSAPTLEQAEERKQPKRTPTQKADAASGASGDDIPF